jgi:hypothetical protein
VASLHPRRPYAALGSLLVYLLLMLVLPGLKLAGLLASWSWWQVTSPFWVVYGVLGLAGFVALMVLWVEKALGLKIAGAPAGAGTAHRAGSRVK